MKNCSLYEFNIRDVTGEFPEDMMPNFEHFFGVVDRLSESTGWGSRGRNQVFENVPSDSNYPDCIEEILAGLKQNRETHEYHSLVPHTVSLKTEIMELNSSS